MDKFENAIGIDVSKNSLDAYDYHNRCHVQVSNDAKGFKQLITWARKQPTKLTTLWCFEHTGVYSLSLAVFLTSKNIKYAVVSGLEIKRSMGITRGKSDKVDARLISRYAYHRREEIRIYQLPSKNLLELNSMIALRERLVSQRAGFKSSLKEMKQFSQCKASSVLFTSSREMIKALDKQIIALEGEMMEMIKSDEVLYRTFKLITSVKGVGPIIAINFLVYTNCFTAFTDWRKFACYCGIVPFEYQSGTSIRGRRKVHHLANRRLKALLSNAACTSIQFNPEMKLYYQRRIAEGKDKMSTQNIIRNKIVARIFATVQRGTPYVETLRYAA